MYKKNAGIASMIIGLLIPCIGVSQEYHFVSIEMLIEQEIGRIIIPEIYQKLNIKVSITPVPGNRAQWLAASGEKDGEIMRIWTYGDENPSTIRVPTSYYSLETMAFIKKDAGISISRKEEMTSLRIVKVRGVKHTDNISKGMPNLKSFGSTENMMLFLNAGRADIALTNTIDGLIILKKMGLKNIVPLKKPLAVLELYHYIHEKHKALVPKINAVLIDMKKSGELKALIRKAENTIIQQSSRYKQK
jgi:polar amino acid transport system substrate-binding protein